MICIRVGEREDDTWMEGGTRGGEGKGEERKGARGMEEREMGQGIDLDLREKEETRVEVFVVDL